MSSLTVANGMTVPTSTSFGGADLIDVQAGGTISFAGPGPDLIWNVNSTSASVTNDGTITQTGTNSSVGPAIGTAGATPTGTLTVTNTGTISSLHGFAMNFAAVTSAGAETVTNSGTVSGGYGIAIYFGAGADTYNVTTGSTTVGRVIASGTGTLNLSGTGSGTVYGLSENVSQSTNLGTFAGWDGFSTLNVNSGNWTLQGEGAYSALHIASGAALFVSSHLPQDVVTTPNGNPGNNGLDLGNMTIVNNGSLNVIGDDNSFDYNPTAAFNFHYSGNGQINFLGTGVAYITPAMVFTVAGGGVTVSNGKLFVLGTITTNVLINSGATMQLGGGGAVFVDPAAGSGTYTDNGLTGTSIGNITDNGTLIFDRLDDAIAPGTLLGNGVLQKLAPSALTFNASSNFGGRVLADGGTLNLAGTIATTESNKAAVSSSGLGLAVTVSNSGQVSSATGAAIDMSAATNSVTIRNSGTLTGGSGQAILLTNIFNDALSNSGTINGAISFGAGTNTFTNTGTVNGAVNLGNGAVTLVSTVGAIHGAITLGTGTDAVTLGAEGDTVNITVGGSDTITLGAGADTLTLLPSNAALTANVSTVNHFQVGTDKVDIAAYLNGLGATGNPYTSGYLRLTDVVNLTSEDTLIQVDQNGGGDNYQTVMVLKGVSPFLLTAANFDLSLVNPAPPTITSVITAPPAGGPVTGTTGDDIITGGAGNDIIRALGGTNIIDGGAGLNTVVFDGPLLGYAISTNGGTVTVTGGPYGETDILTNVQRLQFTDGYVATGPTDFAGKVYRIYEATLNRAPDPSGLDNWVHALTIGQSLQTVVAGFVGSQEFINTYGALDNAAFVTLLYTNVLHRAPDTGGLNNWVGLLNSGTDTRAQVVLGFSESQEDINNTTPIIQQGQFILDPNAAEVARLYDTAFGRLPDAAGLANWTHLLDNGTDTLLQVAQGFTGSQEFLNVYGSLDNTGFVTDLYLNTLHRAPDTPGLNNWVGLLNSGTDTRAQVVIGFSESQEHINNTAAHINNGVFFAG